MRAFHLLQLIALLSIQIGPTEAQDREKALSQLLSRVDDPTTKKIIQDTRVVPATPANLPSKILVHLKLGGGIPFQEVVPVTPPLDKLRALAEQEVRRQIENAKSIAQPLELPSCGEGEQREIPLAGITPEKAENPDFAPDVIFLPASNGEKPNRSDFGPHVRLAYIDSERSSPASFIGKLLNIPCLPFRFTIRDRKLVVRSGKAALEGALEPAQQ